MTRRKRTVESTTAKVVKVVKKSAATAAEATAHAAKVAVNAAETYLVKPVGKALGMTPKKPKAKKVRKKHVRPPKHTPAPAMAKREAPKTTKAKTLTHSVAKTLPKAGAKTLPQAGAKTAKGLK